MQIDLSMLEIFNLSYVNSILEETIRVGLLHQVIYTDGQGFNFVLTWTDAIMMQHMGNEL